MLNWEPPRTRRQLQLFLGSVNFYCSFIKKFAQVALSLTDVLKTKGKPEGGVTPGACLVWSEDCQQVFKHLKTLFTIGPIQQHPDKNKKFSVQVDACDVAMGVVILQEGEDSKLHPCTYAS